MKKLYDLTAVTGQHTDRDGAVKKRYLNVGAVFEGDDGGMFVTLVAYFNPAGIARREGKDSIVLSCFEPRDQQQSSQAPRQRQPAPAQAPAQRQPPAAAEPAFDDDIPF